MVRILEIVCFIPKMGSRSINNPSVAMLSEVGGKGTGTLRLLP